MFELMRMSLNGALLVAVVCVLRLVLGRRLPRTAFVVLWLAALFRLLCPIRLPFGASVWRLLEHRTIPTVVASGALSSAPHVAPPLSEAVGAPWEVVWLAVAAALLSLVAVLYLRGVIRARWAKPLPCGAYLCGEIAAPQVCGVLFPRILLPEDVDEAALPYILLHEQTHIRRLDNLWKLLALIAAALHWFNPAAWVLAVLLSRDLELSCDEWVLRKLNGEQRQDYALSLLAIAERPAGRSLLTSGFSQNPLEERIRCIMNGKKKSMLAVAGAIVMTMCTVAAFATDAPIGLLKDKVEFSVGPSIELRGEEQLELFTAEEYEVYLEEQKAELQQQVKDGVISQETCDNTIADMEKILEGIKAGTATASKPFVTKDGASMTYTFTTPDNLDEDEPYFVSYSVSEDGAIVAHASVPEA